MTKKILISGYYGFNNSGDDAILKVLTQQLKEIGEKVEIVALSNQVEQTEKNYNIRAINRYNLLQITKEMKSCDLFISGGGTLLQDGTSNRSLYYYLMLLHLAKKHCKRVMVFANGMGPIKSGFNRRRTLEMLKKVDVITLRDQDSYDFLMELGLKHPKISVTFDPVFMMKSIEQNRINRIFEEENLDFDKKYIGISVRPWKEGQYIESGVKALVKSICDKGYEVVFIPMQHPHDDKISQSIIDQLDDNSRVHCLKGCYEADEMIGIMSKMDYIVAMRYHALIYAILSQRALTAISYDPKVRGLMDMLKVNSVCSMAQLREGELDNIVEKGIVDKSKTIDLLEMSHDEKLKSAYENIEIIKELLEGIE
ncbi:MAG: polysaccharide pyruvyl transferase CsaB [Tissierellales bacterium]|jgi:polysaccharide pyruvyl transferase CsaB|nr:polysaccharide pyruvyl transferase CsaB [Tissierellales bacterium]